MDLLEKQPTESRLYDMDFGPRLAAAEAVSSLTSVTQQEVDQDTGARSPTTDLTISDQAISGQLAQARIAGGVNGKLYLVTFLVTTDLGNTVEAEGLLLVRDI